MKLSMPYDLILVEGGEKHFVVLKGTQYKRVFLFPIYSTIFIKLMTELSFWVGYVFDTIVMVMVRSQNYVNCCL